MHISTHLHINNTINKDYINKTSNIYNTKNSNNTNSTNNTLSFLHINNVHSKSFKSTLLSFTNHVIHSAFSLPIKPPIDLLL
jgi:hypothetical protein